MPIIGSRGAASAGGFGQRQGARKYSIDFLVIAGGGSGGGNGGGGGGAGGYRTSYGTSGGSSPAESKIDLTFGKTYTITVGAGAPTSPNNDIGSNGNPSEIIGVGVSLTSLRGGGTQTPIGDEPCGSGSGRYRNGGSTQPAVQGTAGQGSNGGTNGPPQDNCAGGGGGAGSVGGNASNSTGGTGGNGLSSNITGSPATRAGGGGGGTRSGTTAGNGSGGGGNGGNGTGPGSAASATGAGGGGGGLGNGSGGTGGAGGGGMIVLRIPTAEYSGTTTGSPTVATDGSDTVVTYSGSGSYTA